MSDPTQEAMQAAQLGVERAALAETLDELAELDTQLLGKKGRLGLLKSTLRDAEPDQRKEIGRAINESRVAIESAIEQRRTVLEAEARRVVLLEEAQDLTEALGRARTGHVHPITLTWERLEDVFVGMGFTVEDGPEIETDWFNFEALNLPEAHPARSLWDTLYVDTSEIDGVGDGQVLLRTHTSPVQIRTMLRAAEQGSGPPIYAVCPGRVYRRDTADATHLPVFHQIEGLVIDRGISMADLAGTIEEFTKAYFGESMTSRLRPSYFPFTEPSAEMDISQPDGSWLEIGGCGMVHPNVLRHCGLDPEEWTGFAFGFGIDRLAKIRHDVADLRDFVTNDMRFLEQF
ncbi:MAG: phenylalanine--tRNA ligase subunit alpha [Microthrixaceae bacterium]|nr:phenylalanine--tRNA ligase subunit alpha [Microthrixaceae bacterium]MCB9386536.1 phenylalanine--tRNA ligase subunit alpha [Microthrixaceae bacterium]